VRSDGVAGNLLYKYGVCDKIKQMDVVVKSKRILTLGGKEYRCALGRSGVNDNKKEGDGATPVGCFPMRELFYRPDRFDVPPQTGLLVRVLSKDDGWSDDANLPEYNTFVKLPYEGSHEKLWRNDNLYDLIVPLGYNDNPPVSGKGSAIFMHIAHEEYSPTEGCIALSKKDLLEILADIDSSTQVCIEK